MIRLGLQLEGIATALDLEEGLAHLNQQLRKMEGGLSGSGAPSDDSGRS
jgi:hypothetical protein